LAVAALVLGIIGTLASCFFFLGGFVPGIPLAVVALVLAIIARKSAMRNGEPTATATAGLVLGIVGLVIGVGGFSLCASALKKVHDLPDDPKLRERMLKERIKTNQEFNEAFEKALEESAPPSPAPAPSPAPSPTKK
jgi:hypothetical protein